MTVTSRPYQITGQKMITDNPATMLADDMGTGKSKIVVDAVFDRMANFDAALCGSKRQAMNVLILCPKPVCAVWPQQFERHATGKYRILVLDRQTTAQRSHNLHNSTALTSMLGGLLIVVVNYEAAWQGKLGIEIRGTTWDMIVCDESQRIKSAKGKTSRFVGTLGLGTRKRVCLSGTPLAHSPLDAFGQYRFLAPGIFGRSFTRFRNRYAVMGGFQGKQVLDFKNMEEFTRKFYSIARRVKACDVLTLPNRQDIDYPISLGAAEAKHYRQMDQDFVTLVQDGLVTAANAAVKVIRLQQMTSGHTKDENGIVRVIGTSKADAVAALLDGLDPSSKVVVFCRFTMDIKSASNAAIAQGREWFELSGQANTLAQWQSSVGGSVIGVQLQAGGVGVDLSMASKVIYFSMGTSLGDYEQSRARVHRPGQTEDVTYWHLIATRTRDVVVYRALRKRKSVIEEVLKEIA